MKKSILIEILLIVIILNSFPCYATVEEQMTGTEEMQEEVIFDDIQPEDLDFEEVIEPEENITIVNRYTVLVAVIVISYFLYIFYKVGISKKIVLLFLGTASGIFLSIMLIFVLDKMAQFSFAINDKSMIIATLGICLYGSFYIISNLDELKDKTEDILWKELFKKGMEIGRKILLGMMNIIVLSYIGIAMIFVSSFIITKEMACIAISGCIGMIFSMIVSAFLYSIIYSKKTIYKTVSENKVDGKRSLKL